MSLFDRLRQPTPIRLSSPPPPAVDLAAQLEAAQQRTYAAEDATRAMQIRLAATIRREQDAGAALGRALIEMESIRDQARQLGSEVAALRTLLVRAQAPRGTDRLCPECHNPMSFGMAHYCPRTSEYTEGVAA